MKLNLDYTNDPRWEMMSQDHRNRCKLPNLFLDILYSYQDKIPNLSKINFALETGTHDARTTTFLAEHFDIVFSIELNPDSNPYDGKNYREHYNNIQKKHENITFLFGHSEDTIQPILEEIPDERFFILLDAHTHGNGPLREELKSIKKFSNRNDHVF